MTVAYDALIDSEMPEFVVLMEVQPMEELKGWTAAGGGLTNTYYVSFTAFIATAVVAGGLYRRLDEVRYNATALTSRASAALVDANLGSYYFDTAASRLYVSLAGGVNPETATFVGAWFTLFFSTRGVSFSDQPLYYPLIDGDLPAESAEMPDSMFGSIVSDTGAVSLLNGDGVFDKLSRLYVWRNKRATFRHGGVGLAYTDFAIIDTLRINTLDANDENAIVQVEAFGNILNKSLPLRTWGDGTLFNAPSPQQAADGIQGLPQPLVLGTVVDCPCVLGGRNGLGGADYWYAYDFNAGAYGTCQVFNVYAIHRATKARTLLTGGDYVVSGANIQVINAAYFYENYDIVCSLRQLATLASPTFGTMALALLRICGESDSNIDLAAFATADTAAPQVLARYIGVPGLALNWMNELQQSVNGQVYQGADGKWTCRVLTPDAPANPVALSDADFKTWTPTGELLAVLDEVRVRYGHRPLADDWFEAIATLDAIGYSNETTDAHRLDTWLTVYADAYALAHHLLFFRMQPGSTFACEERGLRLNTSRVGDLVSVTRARAPLARTGRYDGHLLRIAKLEKALGPDAPTVRVWLNDLNGQVDRIFRLLPSGSTLTWDTATAEEKALYGFLSDGNGYLETADPLTRHAKVLW